MPVDPDIGTREREILTAIVETFISTGEPVGSRTLARSNREGLSPASIRNVMADLADEGYLAQPHTSAGRVPTEKAFRSYVRSIGAARTAPYEADRLRSEFSELHTIGEQVERSSYILMELTRNHTPYPHSICAHGISSDPAFSISLALGGDLRFFRNWPVADFSPLRQRDSPSFSAFESFASFAPNQLSWG